MTHTLIASPDDILLETVRQCLVSDGHIVSQARTLAEAQRAIFRVSFSLCCIDSAYKRDQVRTFRDWLRANPNSCTLPVVLIAPRSAIVASSLLPFEPEVQLESVVSKPLHFEPLRREIARLLGAQPKSEAQRVLRSSGLTLDSLRRQIFDDNGASTVLTPTEFRLLHYLMEHAGETRSPGDLLERVWGYPPGTAGPEIVRAHVRNLRDKFKRCGLDPALIRTLPGHGYSIAIDGE